MRIAVVCSDPRVRVPGSQGASLHLEAISRALQDIGHQVLVIGVAGHDGPPDDLETLLLPHPGRAGGLRREVRAIRFTARLARAALEPLRRFGPDVVYERLAPFGVTGRRLARALGARHVLEVDDLLGAEAAHWRGLWLGDVAERRERHALDGADLRLPVSAEIAAEIRRTHPGAATAVVPNGLDERLFRVRPARGPARLFYGLPGDAEVLVLAGSLQPGHGVDVALRALPMLPGVHLCVAGDGPSHTGPALLAADLGVADRVHWLGQLPHREMPRMLAAADVALAPYSELPSVGFSPIEVFEYLGAGVPVVASDLGQVHQVLDGGRWGSLVAPGDPAALAAGVLPLLANAAEARCRADAAREMALREHSWRARAARITDLLTELEVRGALAA